MSGLVSFTLFGDDPNDIYFKGAVTNAQDYKQRFPDWDLWFYVGKSVPDEVVQRIKAANPRTEFDFVDDYEDQTSTWWRYRAIKHSSHDAILFRDVDSRLSDREVCAIEEWLGSEFPYHAIRDHQYHGRPLLAGLWGLKQSAFSNHRKMPDSINGDYYGTDQVELLTYVWPVCKRQIMTHIGCYHVFERAEQRRPLRVPRTAAVPFVAQGFNGDDTVRYPEHVDKVDTDEELMELDYIFKEEYRRGYRTNHLLMSPREDG